MILRSWAHQIPLSASRPWIFSYRSAHPTSTRETRWAKRNHHPPGNHYRYCQARVKTPTGQAPEAAGDGDTVGEEESVLTERTGISHWHPPACLQSDSGRSFLHHAIALLRGAKKQHHHIRLNKEFRSDLLWWRIFAPHCMEWSLPHHP